MSIQSVQKIASPRLGRSSLSLREAFSWATGARGAAARSANARGISGHRGLVTASPWDISTTELNLGVSQEFRHMAQSWASRLAWTSVQSTPPTRARIASGPLSGNVLGPLLGLLLASRPRDRALALVPALRLLLSNQPFRDPPSSAILPGASRFFDLRTGYGVCGAWLSAREPQE